MFKISLYSFMFLFLFSCTPGGLQLISYLEARQLKTDLLEKRKMCERKFTTETLENQCYSQEMALLIADNCELIRKTEPIDQEECQNLMYKIVLKPVSMFPNTPDNYEWGFPGIKAGCGSDSDCDDNCERMFPVAATSSQAQTDCKAYSPVVVERMYALWDYLTRSTTKEHLDALNLIDFERLLKIHNGFLSDIISDEMSANQVRNFKAWILGSNHNEDALALMHDYDSEQRILDAIFGSDNSDTADALAEIQDNLNERVGSQNPIEIALSRDDELTLQWFNRYLLTTKSSDSNVNALENYYCHITLSNSGQESYLEYDFFKAIVDDVLANNKPTPAPDWWTDSVTSENRNFPKQWNGNTRNNLCDALD